MEKKIFVQAALESDTVRNIIYQLVHFTLLRIVNNDLMEIESNIVLVQTTE